MFIHGVAGTSIPDVQGAAQVSASHLFSPMVRAGGHGERLPASARVTARLSGKRVEALSERTETSTTE